jgi:hypothetical protein
MKEIPTGSEGIFRCYRIKFVLWLPFHALYNSKILVFDF